MRMECFFPLGKKFSATPGYGSRQNGNDPAAFTSVETYFMV
jgi:hypothetical protein